MPSMDLERLARKLHQELSARHYVIPPQMLEQALHSAAAGHSSAEAAVPVVRAGDEPLSRELLRDMQGRGKLCAIVEVELNDIINGDLDSFLEELSERVTGSRSAWTDISYAVTQKPGSPPNADCIAIELRDGHLDWESLADTSESDDHDGE
jgi:hypothetical protein